MIRHRGILASRVRIQELVWNLVLRASRQSPIPPHEQSRPMSLTCRDRAAAERTFLQGLVSLAGAAGIALLVPFAILLVGLPVVLAVRGVLEVIGWLFGVALQ